jgi:hypothetical protein
VAARSTASPSAIHSIDPVTSNALLVRDIDGQYRPAGADEFLTQSLKTEVASGIRTLR